MSKPAHTAAASEVMMTTWTRGGPHPLVNGGAVLLGAVLFGCGQSPTAGGDSGEFQAGPGEGAASGGGPSVNDGGSETGDAPECGPSVPCSSGVCVEGICCATEAQGCGSVCCEASEFCSFGACLVPEGPCQSAADCEADQYCETALGDEGSAQSGDCGQSMAANGRCLDLPPICDGGAEGGVAGEDCIEICEYRPEAGRLKPQVKWQWGIERVPEEFPEKVDVWATPVVARVFDANCDDEVNESDPPNVIFVSGDVKQNCCQCTDDSPSNCLTGVLRVLDGRTGEDLLALSESKPGHGFAATSVAAADMDGDQRLDIVAVSGDGHIVVVDGAGSVKWVSDEPVDAASNSSFGWGGGLAIGDMDGDGHPEIAYGRSLFTTKGSGVFRVWVGADGRGDSGGGSAALSFFVDLDKDGDLELLAGNTAYQTDGSVLWKSEELPDGSNAVADFDADGLPEVVLVSGGEVWVLEGLTGAVELGPVTLPGGGKGGPPTVADFDADGSPEIGVAEKSVYVMLEPTYRAVPAVSALEIAWQAPNHDFSSSVTGSSVFDFEGDGKAEVVYNDECFLWVYDGATGEVLLARSTLSFTATEASIVADVDADGHAEIVMVSNAVRLSTWKCNVSPWTEPDGPRPGWEPPAGHAGPRGITLFGDQENSWVGTRTIWNQHAYSVTNVCDSRDSACTAPNTYGSVPKLARENWNVSWLNNFRQNVQDEGLFRAPDAVLALRAACTEPVQLTVTLQNVGMNVLPTGVNVEVVTTGAAGETFLGIVQSTRALAPGQSEQIPFTAPDAYGTDTPFIARIVIDPLNRTFNECREGNNESDPARASCGPA